jgi:hypothetical protein
MATRDDCDPPVGAATAPRSWPPATNAIGPPAPARLAEYPELPTGIVVHVHYSPVLRNTRTGRRKVPEKRAMLPLFEAGLLVKFETVLLVKPSVWPAQPWPLRRPRTRAINLK